jgi:hypothetical protein
VPPNWMLSTMTKPFVCNKQTLNSQETVQFQLILRSFKLGKAPGVCIIWTNNQYYRLSSVIIHTKRELNIYVSCLHLLECYFVLQNCNKGIK